MDRRPHGQAPLEGGSPAAPLAGAIETLGSSFYRLVAGRIGLLSLELQSVAQAMLHVAVLLVCIAIVGATAWLIFCSVVADALTASGMGHTGASMVVFTLNAVAACVLAAWARRAAARIALPATAPQSGVMAAPPTDNPSP